MTAPSRTTLLATGLAALIVACGEDSGSLPGPDASTPTPDAGRTQPPIDAAVQTRAALAGVITRSTEPQAGGVGNLYVAVFDGDPIAGAASGQSAAPVGQVLVEEADMSATGAAIPYRVDELPIRQEPYHVVAFLDDNGTASTSDPASAGPDRGDLVSMDGLSAPSVVIDADVEFDIDLNFAMPF